MQKTLRNLGTAILFLSLYGCAAHKPLLAQTSPFPTSLDTQATLKLAVNGVSTLLTSMLNTSQTSFSVSACAGIVPNVLITIDQEIMPVTGCAGTVIVVGSRGFDSTTAATHQAGATVYAYVDAWNINAADVAILAIENALGVNLGNINTGAATTFTASATGTTPAVTQTSNNFSILGNGNATFGTVAGTSFTASATGATVAVGQSGGNFSITGAGNATFADLTGTTGVLSSLAISQSSGGNLITLTQTGSGTGATIETSGNGNDIYASSSGSGDVLYAGNTGTGNGIYALATGSGAFAVDGLNTAGIAVYGQGSTGIYGTGTTYAGYFTGSGSIAAVYAVNTGSGAGIEGATSSTSAVGVLGQSAIATVENAGAVTGNNTAAGYGVYGLSASGIGGYFTSTATAGDGVLGVTSSGYGVGGTATSGNGVQGTATTGIGVYGHATGAGYGVYGVAAAANAYGGYFQSSSGTALAVNGTTLLTPTTYGALPTCNSGALGTLLPVSNSNTNTWGATISGTGADAVLAWCNGSAWTVYGK